MPPEVWAEFQKWLDAYGESLLSGLCRYYEHSPDGKKASQTSKVAKAMAKTKDNPPNVRRTKRKKRTRVPPTPTGRDDSVRKK